MANPKEFIFTDTSFTVTYGGYRGSFTTLDDNPPIYIDNDNANIWLRPDNGSSRIEYTLSLTPEVEAGTAEWLPWPSGDVLILTEDTLNFKVTAIRVYINSGSAIVYIHSGGR